MITEQDKQNDVMLDKEEEKVFEQWLADCPRILNDAWEKWHEEKGDFNFYLKNRLRRAFERGSSFGKYEHDAKA